MPATFDPITGVPLEPRGCIAIPDPSEDALTIWAPSQVPHIMRTIVAECLKMPESKVRARVPDIGGGFGIKIHVNPEEVLVAYLARTLGVAVKGVQQRVEAVRLGLVRHQRREHGGEPDRLSAELAAHRRAVAGVEDEIDRGESHA